MKISDFIFYLENFPLLDEVGVFDEESISVCSPYLEWDDEQKKWIIYPK